MAKITFHSSKSKFKKFQDTVQQETKKAEKAPEILIKTKEKNISEERKIYKNKNEAFTDLFNQLVNRYNIDNISVYLSLQKENRLFFKKLYGFEISKYMLEKYFGFDCPMICTNIGGMFDNISHRARLIEHIGDYIIIVSSSAYEVYRKSYDIQCIRQIIKATFTEVEKLK